MNDRPIHLTNYGICPRVPHSEPSVTVPVWITQSSLDGLNALIRFCAGFEAAGHGQINGHFELVMFYRTLEGAIRTADQKHKRDEPN